MEANYLEFLEFLLVLGGWLVAVMFERLSRKFPHAKDCRFTASSVAITVQQVCVTERLIGV